jgi:hypothetical protein
VAAAITLDVVDPRSDPEPAYWAQWRASSGMWANWSYQALRVDAWTGRGPLVLCVLRSGAEILGVVSAYISGLPLRRTSYISAGRRQLGLVDVRAPHSTAQQGWWFDSRLSVAEQAELCRVYVRAMRRELGWRVWAVAWRHARTVDLPMFAGRRTLVRRTPALPVIDLPFGTSDDWLASLSRSRRTDLRRQFRRVAEHPDVHFQFGRSADLVGVEEFARLLSENLAKYRRGHRGRRPHFSAAWLEAVFRVGGTLSVTYRDHTGRLLAASIALDHPSLPVLSAWGAVPAGAGGFPHLYFDMYGQLIRWALDTHKGGLILGHSQVEVKTGLGAQLVPEHLVLTGLR